MGGQVKAKNKEPQGKVGRTLAQVLPALRRSHLKPPPRLTLVEWADQYRHLSAEASSLAGRWVTERVEVARGPMLAASDPEVREITVMCCTQLMKTELLLNLIGFFVHQDPAPILLMQPTVHIAEAFSKDRVDPMFRDSPALKDKLGGKKSRDGGNTILHKQFAGGHLTMVGANAPGELAMRPVRIVLCDEVDKYPVSAGDEGDPIKLAAERSATFWNYLIVKVCSPTIEGKSRIAMEYDLSDKRVFEVPCPYCDERQEMRWERVYWPEGQPELAAHACRKCGVQWSEPERQRAIAKGTWRATAPFNGHAGFKVSKLASPWEPLSKLAKKWVDCQGKPEQLKTFYNTQLAETFKEVGEAPPWKELYERRESYSIGSVPADALMLTAGVDVQKDRLEYEVVGWAPGKRSYSIEYGVIRGDTENTGDDGPWEELQTLITSGQWEHASGVMLPLRFTAIDSGFRTSTVYDFCRRFSLNKVAPIKGRDDQAMAISAPRKIDLKRDGKAVWKSLRLYTVGSSLLKSEFYDWLGLKQSESGNYPPGYCHFPEYEEQHFKELTSEQVMVKISRGYAKQVWVKTPGVRNEPLDCRVYARAAAAIAGMDRWRDRDWDALAEQFGAERPAKAKSKRAKQEERVAAPVPQARPAEEDRSSSFLGGGSIWD